MKWIDQDQDSRASSLSKLLPSIRLHHIDTNFLFQYVLNKSNDRYFITLVDEVKRHLFDALTRPERIKTNARLVIVYQEKIAIFNPFTSVVELQYPFDTDSYTSIVVEDQVILVGANNVRTDSRQYHAVQELNGGIYVLGGLEENTMERWDTKKNKWKYVASMQHKRAGVWTAVCKGKLFVMGGKSAYRK